MLAAPALSHAQYTENDRQNPKEYTNEDSQPLRIAAYIIAPVGFLLEWTVARPIHYVANNTFLAPVFNGDTSRPRDYEPIAELPPDPSMEPGRDLLNTTRNRSEKIGTLYFLVGKERLDCRGGIAGDIVAAVKLKETHTGDTLAHRKAAVSRYCIRIDWD